MSEAFDLSHEWFEWLLTTALRSAVDMHGDPARMVAWTVMEDFKARLPHGNFTYHGSDKFATIPSMEAKA